MHSVTWQQKPIRKCYVLSYSKLIVWQVVMSLKTSWHCFWSEFEMVFEHVKYIMQFNFFYIILFLCKRQKPNIFFFRADFLRILRSRASTCFGTFISRELALETWLGQHWRLYYIEITNDANRKSYLIRIISIRLHPLYWLMIMLYP